MSTICAVNALVGSMACARWTLSARPDATSTDAPSSSAALATASPIPDVPPKIAMRFPASLNMSKAY